MRWGFAGRVCGVRMGHVSSGIVSSESFKRFTTLLQILLRLALRGGCTFAKL